MYCVHHSTTSTSRRQPSPNEDMSAFKSLQKLLLCYGLVLFVKNMSMVWTLWTSPCTSKVDYHQNLLLSSKESFMRSRTKPTSPACRPKLPNDRIKRIYFTHMRKAGGTTLRRYLLKVADYYDIHLKQQEGGPDELPWNRSDTLYVTHMRDPVNRSLSHFKYEGRWSCSRLMNDQFVPTKDNAHTLEEWVHTEFQGSSWTGGHAPTGADCKHKLWLCSNNCYIKWLNWEKGRCVRELVDPTFLETTLYRLYKYHLIIDVEKLFWSPTYVQQLEEFFGLPGLADFKANARCDKPSKEANQEVPLEVSDELLAELKDRNALDYRVYEELMTCKTTQFPSKKLADLI